MEKLRKLNLSIPALDSIECKSLMGGDGYYQGSTPEDAIPLPLFEKVYDNGEPDHDYPTDDGYYEDDKSYLEDERTGDHDNDLENNSNASHDNEHDSQQPDKPNLEEVIKTLPENFQNLYFQLVEQGILKVIFVPNSELLKNGEYKEKDGKIQITVTYWPDNIGEPNWYTATLRQELFHCYQYQLGITSMFNFKAPIEYQENLMGWLAKGRCDGFLGEKSEEFNNWMKDVMSPEGEVDLNKFVEGVDQWYKSFINNHSGGYADDQTYICKDGIADMKWEDVLTFFGYTVLK